MNKEELIKGLEAWDTEMVRVFDWKKGEYYEIDEISRGMGTGIILTINKKG